MWREGRQRELGWHLGGEHRRTRTTGSGGCRSEPQGLWLLSKPPPHLLQGKEPRGLSPGAGRTLPNTNLPPWDTALPNSGQGGGLPGETGPAVGSPAPAHCPQQCPRSPHTPVPRNHRATSRGWALLSTVTTKTGTQTQGNCTPFQTVSAGGMRKQNLWPNSQRGLLAPGSPAATPPQGAE